MSHVCEFQTHVRYSWNALVASICEFLNLCELPRTILNKEKHTNINVYSGIKCSVADWYYNEVWTENY